MNKPAYYLFIILISLNSCTVTKNWKSDQGKNHWNATYDEFNGTEKITFPAQKNAIVYLSSELTTTTGKLDLSIDGTTLLSPNKVNHYKLKLDEKKELKIAGDKATGSFALKYPTYIQKNIQVNYNPNIELLGLSYFLANYNDFSNFSDDQTFEMNGTKVKVKDLYALNLKIASEFQSFLSSKNLAILKTYFDKDFYLHYANLLLSLDHFPNAKITDDTKFLSHFASKADAEKFVKAFNDFSTEINFQGFLSRYTAYYKQMTTEVSQNIPKENFITEMEHFYGKNVENYNLYPSLTIPFGQGFAVGNDGMIGNVFASFNTPKEINTLSNLNLGFDNSVALRTICVHEFGHSFVNPAVDKVDEKVLQSKSDLFEPIKNKMSEQGYNQWKICLYEHFDRANEVIIAKLIGDPSKATEILKDNIENKSFIYLPQILEKLEFWYSNEYFTKTYEQKVAEIIAELK